MAQSQQSFFPETKNIGDPKNSGKLTYDKTNQVYEISGSGTNIWAEKDEFFFAARKVSGDFILTAKIEILTKTGDPHRKIGLMIRQSVDTNSPYADILHHADGLLSLQYRTKQGGTTEELKPYAAVTFFLNVENEAQWLHFDENPIRELKGTFIRNIRLPSGSAFQALTMARSARSQVSRT